MVGFLRPLRSVLRYSSKTSERGERGDSMRKREQKEPAALSRRPSLQALEVGRFRFFLAFSLPEPAASRIPRCQSSRFIVFVFMP